MQKLSSTDRTDSSEFGNHSQAAEIPTVKRFLVWIGLFTILCVAPYHSSAAANKAVAKVNKAIDSIRGHNLDGLSPAQRNKLDRKLDRAWDVLTEHADIALTVIPDVLDREQKDGFLLIDLSHLFVVLKEGNSNALDRASRWLLRADPRDHPSGYFNIASIMGAEHCIACLPAVLKLLELEELHAYIDEHALNIDLELGLLFSIGPYGRDALPALVEALNNSDCIVRRNTVRMMKVLLTADAIGAIEDVATSDPCIEARSAAWSALGSLGSPSLPSLIRKRLASADPVPGREQKAMIHGMTSLYQLNDTALLEEFEKSEDPEVATAAEHALKQLPEGDKNIAGLLANAGSRAEEGRSAALASLKSAVKTGFFKYTGSAKDLEAVLTAKDLPLINKVRAEVLRRASDECLYEFKKLYLTGQLFLQMSIQEK